MNDINTYVKTLIIDLVVLQGFAKDSHLNAKGPGFLNKHNITSEIYEVSGDIIDDMQENILALSGDLMSFVDIIKQCSQLCIEKPSDDVSNFMTLKDYINDCLKSIEDCVDIEISAADNDLFGSSASKLTKLKYKVYQELGENCSD